MSRSWIALAGLMHSGKSTASRILEEEYGYTRLAFAEPVKNISVVTTNAILYEAHRMLPDRWEWKLRTRGDIDGDKQLYRLLHQHVGAYLRRVRGEDYWTRIMDKTIYGSLPLPKRIVIDDLRYPNEAQYLLNQGFRIYMVRRPEKARKQSVIDQFFQTWEREPTKKELKQMMSHESEDLVDQVPYTHELINDGMKDEFEAWIRATVANGVTG